ncbi:hypothetical protein CDAR_22191 [Caerostris darwini]|uniref:Uncharacterized protein n=1 Tax=Caerostris darwini TaxID=1538125 RepID=A0AAV4USP2_9ARAC|nr:hypothetical protein CDAR_22191 [Caerostris darwini]
MISAWSCAPAQVIWRPDLSGNSISGAEKEKLCPPTSACQWTPPCSVRHTIREGTVPGPVLFPPQQVLRGGTAREPKGLFLTISLFLLDFIFFITTACFDLELPVSWNYVGLPKL